jgi:diacylglycerol kinase family enzyme
MKATVIFNRAAGSAQSASAEDLSDRIAAKMAALGWRFKLCPVDGTGLEAALAEVPEDTNLIVIGGGDGSVAAAAKVAMDRDVPLAILPLGTMNVFARDLGIPLDVDKALDALDSKNVRNVDAGYVDDMVFLNSVVLGAFARLARQRERLRNATGLRHAYLHLRKAFREIQGYGRYTFAIADGERKRNVRAGTIQITNNPLTPSMKPMPERSTLTKGVLGVYVDHSRTKTGFAKATVQTLLGGMPADPTITSFTSESIVITPKRSSMEASVDGEVRTLKGPIRFRVAKGALKIWGAA